MRVTTVPVRFAEGFSYSGSNRSSLGSNFCITLAGQPVPPIKQSRVSLLQLGVPDSVKFPLKVLGVVALIFSGAVIGDVALFTEKRFNQEHLRNQELERQGVLKVSP